jgi:CubicO group peptidase (beta-lactamase class C family)
MTLIEDGKLALETNIDEYLPPLENATAPVIVQHLLSHTSGVRSFNGTREFVVSLGRQQISLENLLSHVLQRPCDFAPGDKWRYSNSGYVLLSYLIEKVSGLSFGRYMQRRLFEPLGMNRSSLLHDHAILPKRAYDYQSGPRGIEVARFVSPSWFRGSGALASTIDDMARLETALVQSRIVSSASFARMLEPVRLADGATYPYGLGWGVTQYLGHPVHHHAGSLGGFCGEYCRLPSAGFAVVVLGNHRDFPFHKVACALARMLLGAPPVPTRLRVEASLDDRHELVGSFLSPDGDQLSIHDEDGRLFCRGASIAEVALDRDGDLYDVNDPEVVLRLDRDPAGRISAVTLETPMFAEQRFVRGALH